MDLTVRQLRAFLAVAERRNFTRAAGDLHLSQPALTVQIRRLEEAFGLRLLDRTTRSVELTRIGRELTPILRRLVGELDQLVGRTRELAAGRQGTVRIAALPSIAAGLLPDAIMRFRRERPAAAFVIRDVIASRVLALVGADEVDIGIVGGTIGEPGLEILRRFEDRLQLVVPRDHPLASVVPLTLARIANHPLVLMDRETSVRAVVDAAFLARGLMPTIGGEATYMMTAIGMVRAGMGVTILPASAREVEAEGGLCSRPIDDPAVMRQILVVKRAGRTLPPLCEAFLGVLPGGVPER